MSPGREGETRDLSRGALTLRSELTRGRYLIHLSGELDLAAVDLVVEEFERSADTDVGMIVLDLSTLEFIDSTGIHLLLKLEAASRRNGNRLRMIRGSGAVQRVLELTGADAQLPYLD